MKKFWETEAEDRADCRYEIKMVCEEAAHARVKTALWLSGAGIRELFPPRTVQSIYLDTIDNRALQENLAGISHREKIRFRWYGRAVTLVRGRLENKVRENTLGWKNIVAIETDFDLLGMSRQDFLRRLRGHAPPNWQHRLAQCSEPVQWIAYEREYYTTADQRVRITLDRNLRAWEQRGRARLATDVPSLLPRVLIVEVKCAPDSYGEAQRLVNRLPLVADKCSKFVMASIPGDGPIVSLLSGHAFLAREA